MLTSQVLDQECNEIWEPFFLSTIDLLLGVHLLPEPRHLRLQIHDPRGQI